ncbi:outer membrane protein assembly factor BamA [Marinilabiliaceae bacterium JC017]|nr:outer membrane protein assembly factor BamA [Marinilabiliaceae bacterium JC017]
MQAIHLKIRLLISLLFTCIFYSSAQEGAEISTIKFNGNLALPTSQLKEKLSLQTTSLLRRTFSKELPGRFSWEAYQNDIERLRSVYQKEGYLNVQFNTPEITTKSNGRIKLIINIDAKAPIRINAVTFVVDSTIKLDAFLPPKHKRNLLLTMNATGGQRFRDEAVNEDNTLITEKFNNEGYAYVRATPHIIADTIKQEANIEWNIKAGPKCHFGSTLITGFNRVPEKSIRKQLTYKEGETWTKEATDLSQKYIYNLGMFRVASLKSIMTESQSDTIPIAINLKEAPRFTSRFGVGYGREDKFRTFVDLQYLGFLGGTRRLNLYAKHSALEPYNLSLLFSQPAFLFRITTLTLNPYMIQENEPGYKLDKKGGNVTLLNNISEYMNASIGTFYEIVDLDTTSIGEINEDLSNESLYNKFGVAIGGIYNNARPQFDPVQGYSVALNFKKNGLLFDTEMPFNRIIFEFKAYQAIMHEVILAYKLKMGGINATQGKDFIPVDERFFSGGSRSVRGWARQELGPEDSEGHPIGGNSLLEGSLEARIGLTKYLTGVVFMDAGNVWSDSYSYRLDDLHYAAGAGIRFKTPIGPVGIDFARPVFDSLKNWQIHFNIGHPF